MARPNGPLKAQDILVLLRILVWRADKPWRYSEVAKELGMGASEVHSAVRRAERVGLLDPLTRRPNRVSLTEFLIHGLRYVFPADVLGKGKGMPTAHSEVLQHGLVIEKTDNYVWPSRGASVEGVQISPLYPAVPRAARRSRELYDLLALIDAIRIGKVRERDLAAKELSRRISSL